MIYAEIKTGKKSLIRVSKDTVNGNEFGQIRYWTEDKTSGDVVPTRKGVAFNLEKIPSLVDALARMQADVGNEGANA
tara:strand:- start:412 stop:642 length:231 start_codon:yes stop_codon:yes gene_type:complete